MASITAGAPSGIESAQARISELAALTGSGRASFAALLEAAQPNGRGVRIWDDDAAAAASANGVTSTSSGTVADRPSAWPPASSDGGTTGTGTTGTGTTGAGTTDATGTGTVDEGAATGTYAALPAAGEPWMAQIEQTAAEHGLDPALLAALVWTESGFRADAVSPAGATGLAQLMPATAASLGVDPTDPVQNLDGGARLLAQLLERYDGDTSRALAAYNAGPGRVDAAGGVPAIPETQRYVATVLDRWSLLTGAASPAAAATTATPSTGTTTETSTEGSFDTSSTSTSEGATA